jgi:hypothetical protein
MEGGIVTDKEEKKILLRILFVWKFIINYKIKDFNSRQKKNKFIKK